MQRAQCVIGCNEQFPYELTCPKCGAEIDIWAEESETHCRLCGYAVYNHEKYIN